MKKLLLLFAMFAPLAHAQVNLNTSIPAPQVKGIVQNVNGGTGINSAGLTGCPKVTSGVWTVTLANCSSGFPFTINSFTGCNGSLELGATVTNPTCSATYSSTPASANITNTDGVSSPTNLSSPFTSGTIVGSFSHNAVTTTTLTLTAIGDTTQTATQAYTWNPRIFGGVGTAGATATVTASGTTAILSTSNVLASLQLGAETVGSVFGPFTPSGQSVYLLLKGGSHTFVDVGTGFPFAFNTPTAVSFTNVNGVVVSLFLYQSTNPLTGTFNIRVAS
jgi:hypothetical protein